MKPWKYNRSQKRLPIGGHHFPDGEYVINGDTFDEVVAKLEEHRVRNGREVGEPYKEVISYYARRFPWMVTKDLEHHLPEEMDKQYEMARTWLSYVWANPPSNMEPKKEADGRWDICATCPHNRPFIWPETQEAAEWKRRLFLMTRGYRIPDYIGFCSCHRWNSALAAFLEAPGAYSAKKKDTEQPPECWSRSLKGSK